MTVASLIFALALAAASPPDSITDDLREGLDDLAVLKISVTYLDDERIDYLIGCLGDVEVVVPDVADIDAATACERLAEPAMVQRLVYGPPQYLWCTMQYGGPDAAHITGVVDGQKVDTTADRTNGCAIHDWDFLVGVLPPPRNG